MTLITAQRTKKSEKYLIVQKALSQELREKGLQMGWWTNQKIYNIIQRREQKLIIAVWKIKKLKTLSEAHGNMSS